MNSHIKIVLDGN